MAALISCSPCVGLTLESMSSTMPRGGLRPCTRSIHWPDRWARAAKFLGAASHCVSKPHLTRRSRAPLAALPPTIQRIAGSWRRRSASFTSSYPARRPNTDLPEQPGQCVPTILATACVGLNITRHLRQTEYVAEFAISQQSSIGGHEGAAKLEHQAAVEIQPNSIRSRFTPWVRHDRLARSRVRC